MTTLSENEERFVAMLRELADGRSVDWSDTWTEEDFADAQRASLSGFEDRER